MDILRRLALALAARRVFQPETASPEERPRHNYAPPA
jgi:hypothetical protein